MKRFEYLPLGKELKVQTDIAKRQYQEIDDTFEFDKMIKKAKPAFKKYNRSNLIGNCKYIFYEYYNIKILVVFLLCQNIQFYSRSIAM